jgi:competence ComEA-like helix-hairpin-helix protein
MAIYTRHQAAWLLALVVIAGLGLGIGQWRRAHPELAEKLERFDQSSGASNIADARTEPPATRATSSAVSPSPAGAATTGPSVAARRATAALNPRRAGAAAGRDASPVDLNRASAADLMRLPGIGPVLAARIVAAREAEGPFSSVDDLRRVAGVGAAKIERFRSLVTVTP